MLFQWMKQLAMTSYVYVYEDLNMFIIQWYPILKCQHRIALLVL